MLKKRIHFSFSPIICEILEKTLKKKKQVWYWPYEAPGIVESGLYAITIVCGSKDMSQENIF